MFQSSSYKSVIICIYSPVCSSINWPPIYNLIFSIKTFVEDETITSGSTTAIIKLIENNVIHYEYVTGQFSKDDVITSRNTGYTATISEIKEENHYLINETFNVDTQDEKSQIELFETLDNTILDFSESNPFGDAGKEL